MIRQTVGNGDCMMKAMDQILYDRDVDHIRFSTVPDEKSQYGIRFYDSERVIVAWVLFYDPENLNLISSFLSISGFVVDFWNMEFDGDSPSPIGCYFSYKRR